MLTRIQNSAMTMIGVFTQTHIGHHHHLRNFLFDGADRLLDDSIVRKVFQSDRILLRWNPKQDHSGHAGLRSGFRFTDCFLH